MINVQQDAQMIKFITLIIKCHINVYLVVQVTILILKKTNMVQDNVWLSVMLIIKHNNVDTYSKLVMKLEMRI